MESRDVFVPKPVPVMVISVPVPAEAEAGETLAMTGGAPTAPRVTGSTTAGRATACPCARSARYVVIVGDGDAAVPLL